MRMMFSVQNQFYETQNYQQKIKILKKSDRPPRNSKLGQKFCTPLVLCSLYNQENAKNKINLDALN